MRVFIIAALAALVAGGGAWQFQQHKFDARLLAVQSEHDKRDFRALEIAYAETDRLQNQKDEALRAAAHRQQNWQRHNSDLRGTVDGLRRELAENAANRPKPDASQQAGADYTAALETVFGNCAADLGELAAKADGHASDAQTLSEAWPSAN